MGRALRFRELESIAGQLANSLLSAGVVPGEFIAVLGRNSPQYAALHFGAAGAGVILAHVSVRSTPEEVTAVLEPTVPTSCKICAELWRSRHGGGRQGGKPGAFVRPAGRQTAARRG